MIAIKHIYYLLLPCNFNLQQQKRERERFSNKQNGPPNVNELSRTNKFIFMHTHKRLHRREYTANTRTHSILTYLWTIQTNKWLA